MFEQFTTLKQTNKKNDPYLQTRSWLEEDPVWTTIRIRLLMISMILISALMISTIRIRVSVISTRRITLLMVSTICIPLLMISSLRISAFVLRTIRIVLWTNGPLIDDLHNKDSLIGDQQEAEHNEIEQFETTAQWTTTTTPTTTTVASPIATTTTRLKKYKSQLLVLPWIYKQHNRNLHLHSLYPLHALAIRPAGAGKDRIQTLGLWDLRAAKCAAAAWEKRLYCPQNISSSINSGTHKNTSAVACGALQTLVFHKHFRKSKVCIRHQDLFICLMEHASLYVCACVLSLSRSFSPALSLSLFLSCSPSHCLCTHAVLYAFRFLRIPVHHLRVKSIDARHAPRRTW